MKSALSVSTDFTIKGGNGTASEWTEILIKGKEIYPREISSSQRAGEFKLSGVRVAKVLLYRISILQLTFHLLISLMISSLHCSIITKLLV